MEEDESLVKKRAIRVTRSQNKNKVNDENLSTKHNAKAV